jgi:hypothetical protein
MNRSDCAVKQGNSAEIRLRKMADRSIGALAANVV